MSSKILVLLCAICSAAIFWACAEGTISTSGSEEDTALAMYGPVADGAMETLVKAALADCEADESCKAAMEGATYVPDPVVESSASEDIESSESGASSSESSVASSTTKLSSAVTSSASIITSSTTIITSSTTPSVPTQSSSSVTPTITPVSSSSKAVSSSSEVVATNVRGVCKASVATVEKGSSVTWGFTTLTPKLAAETYTWTFDDGSSITTSAEANPSVSYATTGTYGAKLVVNKGLESESTEITCSNKVIVTGTKVSGCKCTSTATTAFVSASKPANVTWSVSECTGADPFTYSWSNGATGTETSSTVAISTFGSTTPKVTVTNSDGMTMQPTCPTLVATELIGAQCSVGEQSYATNKSTMSVMPGKSFYFKPTNITGWPSGTSRITMDVTGEDFATIMPVAKEDYNNSPISITAPSELGPATYSLSTAGTEVCSVTITVEYPKVTTTCSFGSAVAPGATAKLSLGSFNGWIGDMGDNVTMVLAEGSNTQNLSIGRYYNPSFNVTAPSTAGEYTYTLTYQGNEVCTAILTVE